MTGRSSAATCSSESHVVLQLPSRTADMLDLHLLSEACMLVRWLCNVVLENVLPEAIDAHLASQQDRLHYPSSY